MTSFPGTPCCGVSEEWKMGTRSSPLCDAFAGAHPLFCGKTNWARQRTSHKGREQGDPLMPLLFALGQDAALEAVQARLLEGEKLFAYPDDVYIICQPDRVADVHAVLEEELFNHAHIELNLGKNPSLESRWSCSTGGCGAHCSSQTGQGGRHCLEGRSRVASGAAGGESSWHSDWTARVRVILSGQEIQRTSDPF